MSLLGFLGKQFIDVIQWDEDQTGTLCYRYPMLDREIRNGAVLTVRETQRGLFVNEGKIADLFGPGKYTLTTQTLPVMTYLQNWDKLFESPFKSDVFFFTVKDQTDQRWGTTQPVTIRDKELGALRIRANGVYSYRIADPGLFWTRLVGAVGRYSTTDAEGQLRAAILTSMATALGSSDVPFIDMAANQTRMSDMLKAAMTPVFAGYGLDLTSFLLQSLSLPDEVQERLDRASAMHVVGDLKQYTQFQAAEALRDAAANPGGVAGAGAGLGAGLAMAQALGAAMHSAAPEKTEPAADPLVMIERLGDLLQKGVLTQAEFDAKKTELLAQIR